MGKKIAIVVVVVLFLGGVGGYYYYLSNNTSEEKTVEVTPVSSVLLKNMETSYPPTPKEVVKYYSEIMKVLYNEEYSEEQLEALADRMLELYDNELRNNNPREDYILSLKKDVNEYAKNGYTIVSFTTSSSTDVEFDKIDGYEVSKLYCNYSIKAGSDYRTSQVVYELRKEKETGHWKILGFKTLTGEE